MCEDSRQRVIQLSSAVTVTFHSLQVVGAVVGGVLEFAAKSVKVSHVHGQASDTGRHQDERREHHQGKPALTAKEGSDGHIKPLASATGKSEIALTALWFD